MIESTAVYLGNLVDGEFLARVGRLLETNDKLDVVDVAIGLLTRSCMSITMTELATPRKSKKVTRLGKRSICWKVKNFL